MTSARRAVAATLVALACFVAGCAEPTQLVVYVWTDMTVPLEVEQVRVRVYTIGDPSPSYDNTVPLPESGRMDFRTELSFGAGPRGEDTSRRVRVLVDAIKGSDTLFTTEVRTGFARRKKLRLDVYLARRCLVQAATCLPDQTCGLDGCVSPDVPVDALPPASTAPTTPRDPRTRDAGGLDDAGVGGDAGGPATDGGVPPMDGGGPVVDAGVVDGAAPLLPPRQIAPLSSSRAATANVTLHWEAPPLGTSVALVYSPIGGAGRSLSPLPGTSTAIGPLAPGYYQWRIRTTRGAEVSAWSPTWVFVVPHLTAAHDAAWGTYPDITGDGLGDLVVAAPAEAGSPRRAQVVYFTSLRGMPLSTALTASVTDAASRRLSIACAGDLNGDGYVDVLVGSPDSETTNGIVDVYYGSPTGLSAAPGLTLRPSGGRELFGASVASAGDVDRDGYADIVVGAPDAGVAYVFLGGASGVRTTARDRLRAPPGSVGTSSFGTAVAGTDLDADGYGDIVVGDPRARVTHGAVHVYRSNGTGFDPPASLDDSTGGAASTGFGATLASGEITTSGYGEIAVLRSLGYVGSVTIVQGPSPGVAAEGPSFSLPSTTTDALAAAGDFAADHMHVLALGDAADRTGSGTVYLLDLTERSTPIRNGTAGQLVGASVAYLGDVDGDGNDDLAYAEPGMGQVFVRFGPHDSTTSTYPRIVPGGAYTTPTVRIAGAQ